MASAQMTAKWSPGPKYAINGNLRFNNPPKIGIGSERRNPLDIKPPYYDDAITVFFTFKIG